MTTIYLIRHGTTNGNIDGMVQGTLDIPLNEQGFKQSKILGKRFADMTISAIYSSPLMRALATAKEICAYHQIEPVLCSELREMDCGDLQGLSSDDASVKYPEETEKLCHNVGLFVAPNGESTVQVYQRFKKAIESICERHPDDTVIIVSHGYAIQAYINHLLGNELSQFQAIIVGNTSVSKILYNDSQNPQIEYLGDEEHLSEKLRFYTAANGI